MLVWGATESFLAQRAEQALDGAQPGTARGGEGEMIERVPPQAAPELRGLCVAQLSRMRCTLSSAGTAAAIVSTKLRNSSHGGGRGTSQRHGRA